MDAVEGLRRRGGADWWRRLIAAGVTDLSLRAEIRRGEVVVHSRGTFALPDVPADVIVAAALRGSLSCVSAASRYGLDVLDVPSLPHVAIPRERSRSTDLAIVHRSRHATGGVLVPLLPTLADCLRCLRPPDALVVVDSALRSAKVTVAQIEGCLRGPGSVHAKQVLRFADGRSGSAIETLARVRLVLAGLRVECQVYIEGVGRVGFLVEGWLVVEIDGFAFHAERAQYREDRRRGNRLTALGYRVLRFTYEDVRSRPDHLVDTVRRVIVQGRHHARER